MNFRLPRTSNSPAFFLVTFLVAIAVLLPAAGCKKSSHTSDPRLRQIDEMLDARLPPGTPNSRVIVFLNSQGFPVQPSRDARAVVAVVHRIDTETLQPVTARVTFHFDAGGKLTSYELAPAPDSAPQP